MSLARGHRIEELANWAKHNLTVAELRTSVSYYSNQLYSSQKPLGAMKLILEAMKRYRVTETTAEDYSITVLMELVEANQNQNNAGLQPAYCGQVK
jgi:hypothetical protein